MAGRAGVAVIAVLALAWLAVMERDVRLEARGAAALRSKSEPAVLARAETDLRRANLLNPGTGPDLNRALTMSRTMFPLLVGTLDPAGGFKIRGEGILVHPGQVENIVDVVEDLLGVLGVQQ